MIKRKLKKCKNCEKDRFIFSKGLCNNCYYKIKPTKIRTISDKYKEVLDKKKEIKKELVDKNGKLCYFCGNKFNKIDLVHIIRQSYSLSLRDDERNCILGCRKCHTIFDDGTKDEVMKLKNIEKVLIIMRDLDESYYQRWILR